MQETLYVMLRACIAWIALWIAFSGCGLLLFAAFRRKQLQPWDLLIMPWLGWAGAVAFLQIWHCFLPVDSRALACVSVAGLAGVACYAKPLADLARQHRNQVLMGAGLLLAVVLWMSNQAIKQPRIYDTGLYHLNCIRWAYTYPLIPGLANLHGRFGFNNASFLYTAMLDAGFFKHRSHHLSSSFLMICLLMPCVCAWFSLFKEKARNARTVFYAFSLAPALVWMVTSGYVSSPSPDVPCFLLALLIGGELLGLLDLPPERQREATFAFRWIVAMSLVGLTIKLSFAFFAAGACLVALIEVLRRKSGHPAQHILFAALVALLSVVPWMIRGVFLTGYPAYPAKLFRFTVAWAVPASSLDVMVERIKAWARIPHVPPEDVLGNLQWMKPWLTRVLHENTLDFTFPLLTLLLAVVVFLVTMRSPDRTPGRTLWLILLPPLFGLAMWLSAPDPRYQGSLLWVLAIGLLVLALNFSDTATKWILPLHALVVVGFLMSPIDLVRSWKDPSVAKRVEMVDRTTRSGLKVLVPAEGDQAWDSDLPATPYFSPLLRLRVPGDMSSGFMKEKPQTKLP